MEFKDNRSIGKRSKMIQWRKAPHQRAAERRQGANNTSSSSQVEAVRGIIDVADSSDDRVSVPRGKTHWSVQPQPEMPEFDPNEYDDDLNNAQLRAGDFDVMAQVPTSTGGYFQFSAEKNWEADAAEIMLDNTAASEYFTLNLKLLNVGLQTIPFYKRMDYAASMFSKDQLLEMDKAAEVSEKQYQSVLKEHESNPKIKVNSAGSKRNASAKSQRSAKVENIKPDKDDELDELLNMTAGGGISKLSLVVTEALNQGTDTVAAAEAENKSLPADDATAPAADNVGGNKEDIQQWLDNVLEE